MSKEVDERIVEMRFDNAQFESGVSKTLKTLDKLNESLKFEGVSKAISGVQDAVQRIDMNPLVSGIEKVANSYTTLTGKIKMEVFDRLSSMAVDTGEKIFKALTFGGAKAGLAEYETQQGAVQTILANTQHLGTTINDVTAALDNLNEYADLTIYNFTQMTRNIGTFTAAGLDLETSTSAIKGIANLAAISGSTSEQASRAMYQLSQALAAGRVNLMDWNSVVNAGMGGKVFQDALKNTAKHMGIVVDETKSFRESISGGDTWLSAEVLSETLKQLSGDMTDAELAAQGWSESEIEEIQKMAKTAMDAATVVKTFSQLMDTISEQIGSGWTKTWQLIFGDFEESKELWTGVYKAISPYIEAFSDLRNNHLKFWKENEGRTKVLQAFSNIWSGMSAFIDNTADAFRHAFPIVDNFGQILLDISDRFLSFSQRFAVVKEKTDQVTESFTKVSDAIGQITAEDKKNALDIWNWGNINGKSGRIDGQARVEALGESYDRVQKYINTFIETGYDVAKTDELLGVGADNAAKGTERLGQAITTSLTPQERQRKILANIAGVLHDFATVVKTVLHNSVATMKAVAQAFGDVFDPLQKTNDLKAVTSVFARLAEIFTATAEKTENMRRIFRGLFSAVDIVYQLVRTVVGYIGRALMPALDSIDSSGGGILSVLGDLGDWIYALDQAIKQGDLFSVAIDNMIGFVTSLDDKIIGLVHSFEDWSGINFASIGNKVAKFFQSLFDKIYDLTGIDIGGALSRLWGGIKTFFDYIKQGDFGGAFNFAAEGVKGFMSAIVDGIKNFDISKLKTTLGSVFGKIGSSIGEFFDNMWKNVKSKSVSSGSGGAGKGDFGLLDIIGGVLYGVYAGIKKIIESVGNLLSSDTASNLWAKVKEFFKGLFDSIGSADTGDGKEKTKNFGDILVSIGHYLRLFFDEIKPIIGTLFGGGILKSINDVTTTAKNFSEGPKILAEGLKNMTDAFNGIQKSLKMETLTRFVKALGKVIIEIVIAIAALAIIDHFKPDAIGNGIYAITTMLAEIVGVLMVVNKKMDKELDMTKMARFAKAIGRVVIELTAAFWILSKIPSDQIVDVTMAYMIIMGSLAGMMMIMADIAKRKQFRRGGEAVLSMIGFLSQIAKTMIWLSVSMVILSKIDPERLGGAISAFVGVAGMLAILMYVLTDVAKKSTGSEATITALGGTLMAIAGAMVIASIAVLAMAVIPADKFEQAMQGIALLSGIFSILTFIAGQAKGTAGAGAILAAGAAMMMVAAAMNLMMPAVLILSALKMETIGKVLMTFAGIMGTMLVTLYALSSVGGANVALVGVGLILLAGAFAVLTPAIIAFGTWAIPVFYAFVDLVGDKMADMAKAAGVIALIGLALVAAGAGVAVLGAGLTVLGVGLNVIALATLLMTPFIKALADLISVITALAKDWDTLKSKMVDIGKTLGTTLGGFFGSLSDAITKAEPEIRRGMLSLINILAMSFTEGIPAIVDSILTMIANILIAIDDNLPMILLHLGVIITRILLWIDVNSVVWSYLLADIIIRSLIGIIKAVDNRLEEIVDALLHFANHLLQVIVDVLAMLLVELGIFIGKTFKGMWKFWEEHGANIIDKLVEGAKSVWYKIKNFIVSLFTEKIPNSMGKAWDSVFNWGENIIDNIIGGIKSKWDEAKNTIADFGNAILETLGVDVFKEHSPSEVTTDMGENLVKGVGNGIKNGTSDAKDSAYDSGYDILEQMGYGADDAVDDMDTEYNPDFNINPNLNYNINTDEMAKNYESALGEAGSKVDMSAFTNSITGTDLNKDPVNWAALVNQYKPTNTEDFESMTSKDALSRSTNLADSLFNNTSSMESSNALQTKSNELTEKLNTNMSKLVKSFENGMINIPENATFSTQINLDGKTIADASAPYLDVINADKLVSAEKGYAR